MVTHSTNLFKPFEIKLSLVSVQSKRLLVFIQSASFISRLYAGLAVLAESFPEQILQRLLGEYHTGASEGSPKRERSLETRLKVGEVLMRASRAMGKWHYTVCDPFLLHLSALAFRIAKCGFPAQMCVSLSRSEACRLGPALRD